MRRSSESRLIHIGSRSGTQKIRLGLAGLLWLFAQQLIYIDFFKMKNNTSIRRGQKTIREEKMGTRSGKGGRHWNLSFIVQQVRVRDIYRERVRQREGQRS